MAWVGSETFAAVLDLARDAALLGWLATALFCAVAGVAVALWAGVPWWAGLLLGAVALYLGLALLWVVGAVRAGQRARGEYVARRTTVGVRPPPRYALAGPAAPAWPAGPPAGATAGGVRAGVRRGWRWWTRTPPTRAELLVAVLAVLVAVGLVVATQVTWVTLTAAGYQVAGLGPFAIQLGLFVVLSALATAVCALGVLRRCSAWWSVLLAWFAAWWLFVAVEVVHAKGALTALNRLAGDQIRQRSGYDVHPEIALGAGWSVMLVLAVAMMVLAVALLVLQGRRTSHYPAVARS